MSVPSEVDLQAAPQDDGQAVVVRRTDEGMIDDLGTDRVHDELQVDRQVRPRRNCDVVERFDRVLERLELDARPAE